MLGPSGATSALFAVYMDDLLVELRMFGAGCKVAGVYTAHGAL